MVTFAASSKTTFSVPIEGIDGSTDGTYKQGLKIVRDAYSISGDQHAVATIKAMNVTGTATSSYGLVIEAPTGTATNKYALYTTGDLAVGNVKTGTWQGSIIGGAYGGTGVNNGTKTITLGGNLTTSGAFNTTFTTTADTNAYLPSGSSVYIVSRDSNDTLSNKTINASNNSLLIPYTGGSGSTVQITGVTDNNGILATKYYVDAVKIGLDVKDSVRLATTSTDADISLSGSATIDSVSVVNGDRVLVKNQTLPSDNGIYIVSTSGPWSRASDFNSSSSVTPGSFVFVEQGTVNDNSGWVLTNNGSITVGTTGLTFTQFSGAGSIIQGTGISITGNTISASFFSPQTVGFQLTGGTTTTKTLTVNKNLTLDGTDEKTLTVNNSLTLSGTDNKTLTVNASLTFSGVDSKTLTLNNSLTFTGTDSSSVNFGAGGTVAYTSNNLGVFASTSSAQIGGIINDKTGTGFLVFSTSPSLTTPSLGIATASSINKVSITTPATSATLTLADGSSLITSGANSLTLTTTAASNVTLPTSGRLISDTTGLEFVLGSNTLNTGYPEAGIPAYQKLGFYMVKCSTTDNSTKRLTSDGASVSSSNIIKMPQGLNAAGAGATWFCKIYVTAYDKTNNKGAAWEISAVFRKDRTKAPPTAGNIVLVGDPMVLSSAETGMETCSVDISEDVSNGAINISVTGLASTNINWVATVTTTEIGSD